MIRIDLKEELLNDCCNIYANLSRYNACLPKRIKRIITKSLSKDFKKGLKVINEKAPIYIELPKLKEEYNGAYSKEYDETVQQSDSKEIIVTSQDVINTT